jgi:hypothetical protein
MNAPTVGCLACGQKLEYAYTAMASTPWQVVAFENHTPQPVTLAEVTTVGEEKVLASLGAGEASYYFSRMGAVWRARDGDGLVLMEHRVGPHFLTDDGMGVDFTQLQNYPEWVPNRGPADNEGQSPRFPRTMINAAAGRLEVYARMEDGREVLQANLGPREAFNVVTTWGHTFIARKPSNGDASGEVVATVTMSKVPIRPCSQRSDGTRVVVGVDGTAEEEPVVAPYARPEKSEAQLRELALKVELTKNKTLGPGRHRRFGGIHQWEGVQSGVLPFRRADGARRELYASTRRPAQEPCLACELSTRGSF